MRTTKLALAGLGLVTTLFASAAACATSPAITVVHGAPPEAVKGDPVRIKRGAQEAYATARPGYFLVRTRDDWKRLWDEKSGEVPEIPPTLDLARQMVLVAVAEAKDTVHLRIDRVVETAEFLHVWVKDTKAGEGCATKLEHTPTDAVVSPRIDKPVRFYVEDARSDSCGPPPTAAAQCRVGEGRSWSAKLSAQPGDKVDCELTGEATGRFAIVDRVLSFAELPTGSASKLTYSKGASRGAFTVDVFGTYTVRAEVSDEGGRKGIGNAVVEALPPRTKNVLVQLVWTNFDASDDPETFPRTKLRVTEEAGRGRPRECSAESPLPALCEVKTHGPYTIMTVKQGDKKLPLSVLYRDERVEKGPLVCVQLYFDGQRTNEACDRLHRNADERWDIGTLDLSTGKLVEATSAATDGGAEGGDGAAP